MAQQPSPAATNPRVLSVICEIDNFAKNDWLDLVWSALLRGDVPTAKRVEIMAMLSEHYDTE